jgi:hypothetical protein
MGPVAFERYLNFRTNASCFTQFGFVDLKLFAFEVLWFLSHFTEISKFLEELNGRENLGRADLNSGPAQ